MNSFESTEQRSAGHAFQQHTSLKGENKSMVEKVTPSNGEFCGTPLFTGGDYGIVRDGMEKLTRRERAVVTKRYWDGLSVSEIAEELGAEWHEIKADLESAHKKLKQYCIKDPGFSRAKMVDAA